MKNTQRGFVPLLIIILVVLAIGGGVYVYKNKVNKTEVKTTVDTTASTTQTTSTVVHESTGDESADWKTYSNDQYKFQVKYPSAWDVVFIPEGNTAGVTAGFYFGPKGGNGYKNGSIDDSKWAIQIFFKNNVTNTTGTKFELGDKAYVIFNEGLKPELFNAFLSSFKFTSDTQTSNLKTYTNTEFGISFKYPGDLDHVKSDILPYAFPDTTQVISLKTLNPKFNSGYATVFTDESSTAISQCYTAPKSLEESVTNVATTTINGVPFLSFQVEDAAAGQLTMWTIYRAVHAQACVTLSTEIRGTNLNRLTGADYQAGVDEIHSIKEQLAPIVQSFTFVATQYPY